MNDEDKLDKLTRLILLQHSRNEIFQRMVIQSFSKIEHKLEDIQKHIGSLKRKIPMQVSAASAAKYNDDLEVELDALKKENKRLRRSGCDNDLLTKALGATELDEIEGAQRIQKGIARVAALQHQPVDIDEESFKACLKNRFSGHLGYLIGKSPSVRSIKYCPDPIELGSKSVSLTLPQFVFNCLKSSHPGYVQIRNGISNLWNNRSIDGPFTFPPIWQSFMYEWVLKDPKGASLSRRTCASVSQPLPHSLQQVHFSCGKRLHEIASGAVQGPEDREDCYFDIPLLLFEQTGEQHGRCHLHPIFECLSYFLGFVSP
uniref:Uncharacterized protein n=2 Tax=Mucochytrium quahogii TaxID=96639 RepID=A0A7S2W6V1_9STRA|mmetsp:Transcript_10621/g.19946  ORF Transcript_10621/g.19946 Transcript_10621/m.19946 type:complete len:316 (-) Transcript_10621:73-1020(-)|eukprot:CAMPEP_0203761568 /NCGR_PEP_ID=MMETSP0098-20131031/14618_1 /ASSEMBLY_ACC=CAM_ASM_000208 /TAXON_ID=96639 /ORGANISM=" , Strain NY0313808BC1" /LENGTH=315 /DNA_ID=CAMNT_0050655607 /DNA_START=373 /DNA_END=1320 /DNA_ORIENTATION=+